MSSTNKTTNYELSQFIGSDKPTFLGDYNSDMSKIDTQMKANANAISTADSEIETALTNASTALTNANNAQTSADNANTLAQTAQNTATSALTKATENEASISSINTTLDTLDWVDYGNVLTATITGTSSTGINASYNPKIKLLNLWGYDHLSPALPDNSIVGRLPDSFPAPSSNRTLRFTGIGTNTDGTTDGCTFIIDTDRYIRIQNDANKNKAYINFSIIVNTAFWN